MKKIIVSDNSLSIVDYPAGQFNTPTKLSSWPITIEQDIENYNSIFLSKMLPGEEKALLTSGMDYIRNIFIHGNGIISLKEDDTEVARGEDIYLTGVNLYNAKVGAVGLNFRYAEIDSVQSEVITLKDSNLVNSRLVSTEIRGPFVDVNQYTYYVSIGNRLLPGFNLDIDPIDPDAGISGEEVAQAVTSAITSALQREVAVMTYDPNSHKFTLTATDSGDINLEFVENSKIALGFDSPTYYPGTKKIDGMTVEVINGTGKGETRIINSYDNGQITMDSSVSGLSSGDNIKIIDTTSTVDIDAIILMAQ